MPEKIQIPQRSWIWLLINLTIPLCGVMVLKWNLFGILYFFWMELIALGLFGLLRILAPMAGCAAIAAACAAVTAPLAGLDWRAGVMQAAPIWSLALWPAVYALIVRIAPASPGAMFALALAAHVAGVILDKPVLAHFIFFVAGLALALRREELFRLAREEPEFSIASGPFVVVLSTAIAIRFAATGQPASIAAPSSRASICSVTNRPSRCP